MKHFATIVLFGTALPLLAIAQTSGTATMGTATTMSASASLTSQDKTFISQAAYAGLAEVSDGKLAQSKGSPAVQRIGTQMVTDHSKANDQLASLSQQLGDSAPTTTNASHLLTHATLVALSGAAFDKHYLGDEKLGHQKTIALFKTEVQSGSNTKLKDFATATLPILESHLQMIEAAMVGNEKS